MFSLRHYNRNTTWFIILFSPTINSFFLWKICRCWKEKRRYLPARFFISFFVFKIAFVALLRGGGGPALKHPAARHPSQPNLWTQSKTSTLASGHCSQEGWETCPTCPQPRGYLSIFPGHHQTFPGGGAAAGEEMPLSSRSQPSIPRDAGAHLAKLSTAEQIRLAQTAAEQGLC